MAMEVESIGKLEGSGAMKKQRRWRWTGRRQLLSFLRNGDGHGDGDGGGYLHMHLAHGVGDGRNSESGFDEWNIQNMSVEVLE